MEHNLPIDDYLQYYSLTREPFDSSAPFFPSGGRQELVEQLSHLVQFSSAALVVSGAPGSGRSYVAAEFSRQLADGQDVVCTVDVAQLEREEELLLSLTQAYGLELQADASCGELLVQIRKHLPQRSVVLICNGAELLSDKLLSALLSLLQGQSSEASLRLLLLGDDGLASRLEAFGMLDVLLQDWPLEDFDRQALADYLSFCLAAAGGPEESPFSDEELERLWQVSDGLPGRVNLPARELLADKALAAREGEGLVASIPMVHVGALACLAALLLMAFFYRADWLGGLERPSIEMSAIAVQSIQPVLAVNYVSALVADTKDASAGAADRLLLVEAPAEIRGAQNVVLDGPNLAPSIAAVGGVVDVPPPQKMNVSLVAPKLTPIASKPLEIPSMAFKVAAVMSPMVQIQQANDLAPAERHLLSLAGESYVLQVLSAGSRASVEQFMATQPNSKELYMFVSQRNGQPWFTVVLGEYSSRRAALSAIAHLPEPQRLAGAWPRSVRDVHSKIDENRGI